MKKIIIIILITILSLTFTTGCGTKEEVTKETQEFDIVRWVANPANPANPMYQITMPI